MLPGSGPLRERYIAWREAHAVPPDQLEPAIRSLADDLRERTQRLFGLPDGEHVEWVLETDKPWSGFNYYLGGLRSRVAINVDLPVLSPSLGHLVAHEAYPGHHTEHTRKEVGLVRRRRWQEETIFLVGTPQCLLAEGLADLGVEVTFGRRPEPVVAEHLAPLGVRYDAEVAAAVAEAGEALSWVRSNAAILLHDEGAPVDDVVAYLERWALLPRNRAEKAVSFLTDPTWRAYSHCYIEGLRLCRAYVAGDPGPLRAPDHRAAPPGRPGPGRLTGDRSPRATEGAECEGTGEGRARRSQPVGDASGQEIAGEGLGGMGAVNVGSRSQQASVPMPSGSSK